MPDEAPQDDASAARRGQFTLRRLLLVVTLYACLFPLLGVLAAGPLQLVSGMITMTMFVGWDLSRESPFPRAAPRWAAAMYAVARWLLAYSLCIATSFVVLLFTWEPPTPAPPPTGFFAGLWHVFSGKFLVDALVPALEYFGLLISHIVIFAHLGALSCIAALLVVRKLRRAWWLVILNLPGVLLALTFIWLLVTAP